MNNLRKYGQPPFSAAVIHGGPGAPGSMAPVARELGKIGGILEPLQTAGSLDGQIQELEAVLIEHAAHPLTLIGWSWGAMLSLIFTARCPELVQKLILIGSGGLEARHAAPVMETRLKRLNIEDRAMFDQLSAALNDPGETNKNAILASLGRLFQFKTDTLSPISLAGETLEVRYDIHNGVWSDASQLRASGALLELARQIRCPVLAISRRLRSAPAGRSPAVSQPDPGFPADRPGTLRALSVERTGRARTIFRYPAPRVGRGMKRTAMMQALLAAALFGASAPIAKLLLGEVEPVFLAAFLYLGSGIGALALKRASHQEAPVRRNDIGWLAGAVVAGGIAAPILLLFSLRHTPASTASLLLNFEGVATTLIAAIIFKEAVSRRTVWAILGITAASILLSWNAEGWGISLGALGILGACVLWGIDNNMTRAISAKDPLTIVLVKGWGAGTFSLLLALLLGNTWPKTIIIIGALILGSLSYGLSIALFIRAMRSLGAARTSALFGTAPLMGVLLSFVLIQERPNTLFFAALLLMIAATILLFVEQHGHWHSHDPITHDHRHSHDDGHHTHSHPTMEARSLVHSHIHTHETMEHEHPHLPDIHHRHRHR